MVLLTGCSSSPRYRAQPTPEPPRPPQTTHSEKPQPLSHAAWDTSKTITGVSSYYGSDFHGKLTANGEVYDMYGLTAAHQTLPLNTIVRVTNLANNRDLILRINDRGPFVAGRILDCSYGAAKKLDFIQQGTTEVRIEIIELGDDEYMQHD